jgi:surfeit locus 1 family protein
LNAAQGTNESPPRSARRRGLLVPILFVLPGLAVLIGLGAWQLERKAWKEQLIATLTQRLAQAPADLPPPEAWASLEPISHEFRRVAFPAEFVLSEQPENREARVYTSGTALRDDIKSPGYFAFAPARLIGGSVVVINRGYVADARPTAQTKPIAEITGVADLVGVMRWPEPPGWFVSLHNTSQDLWFARDHVSMAAVKGWGAVAPFYIELQSPEPLGGVPKPAGRIKVNLPNNHMQYALTWFGLAAALLAVFAAWVLARRRESRAERR